MELSTLASIVAMITGVSGMIISILSFKHNQIEALNQYFTRARSMNVTEGKKIIYNSSDEDIKKMIIDFSLNVPNQVIEVVNFYHHMGLLLKMHQLPHQIFYNRSKITASGCAVIRTFNRVEPIISKYKTKNMYYAEYYEYLYGRITKHHPECKDFK